MTTITLTCGCHELELGLLLDGSWGWHNHKRLIDLAENAHMIVGEDDEHFLNAYDRGDDLEQDSIERVIDLMDAAEQWLNNLCPDGYRFGWSDGEFFLMSDEWWEANE